MSKILLIEANPHLRDLIAVNLNMYVGVDVIARPGLPEGIEVLKVVPEMDVVITRDKVGGLLAAHELYRFLQSYPREVPMIVVGDDHQLKSAVKTILGEGPQLIKDIVGATAKILGITAK